MFIGSGGSSAVVKEGVACLALIIAILVLCYPHLFATVVLLGVFSLGLLIGVVCGAVFEHSLLSAYRQAQGRFARTPEVEGEPQTPRAPRALPQPRRLLDDLSSSPGSELF